ncbi:FAD:protein FMN transferase [Novosphingobium album (ex Hu et al. 2023)]|uniref:FAD:protein FMN transferase n=1 Tax=Novosphingobium album (ex Hu et al. 2023) TaxID=2930093 RepID=A0ABT0AX48_9SPHN|nr:FAD:protein FMN transferase [Novosphingobium album (ex Hu et al. 2023)]MCJ2177351.1 FAD:protein FMN transferase [Novosphingobium album (ex Hu et al. 2023)]
MPTRCRPLLGTFVEVTVPKGAASAIDAAFAAIAHVQSLMSFHDEGSDIARIRRTPPGKRVEVAPETAEVLRVARDLHQASGGLFDVTVGHELVRGGFLPKPRFRAKRGRWGTATDIEVLDSGHVRCARPVLIDLGGIAKGYAVDCAVEALKGAGAPEGLVNAGGDIRMFGGRPWPVSLRDADGGVRKEITLTDRAVASSANLGNRRRRWGRVFTPHIGFDRKAIVCKERVTVVADRCVMADAMTKIAMADRGLAQCLLAGHGGYVLTD